MTSPSEIHIQLNPDWRAGGDPLERWRAYPDTTLEELRELDPELFRDVLSMIAASPGVADDQEDDDGYDL